MRKIKWCEPSITAYDSEFHRFAYDLKGSEVSLFGVVWGDKPDQQNHCESFAMTCRRTGKEKKESIRQTHPLIIKSFDSFEAFSDGPIDLTLFNPPSGKGNVSQKVSKNSRIVVLGKVSLTGMQSRVNLYVTEAKLVEGYPLFFSMSGIRSFQVEDFQPAKDAILFLSQDFNQAPLDFMKKLALPEWVKDHAIVATELKIKGKAQLEIEETGPRFIIEKGEVYFGNTNWNLNPKFENGELQFFGRELVLPFASKYSLSFEQLSIRVDLLHDRVWFDGVLNFNLLKHVEKWLKRINWAIPLNTTFHTALQQIIEYFEIANIRVSFSMDLRKNAYCLKLSLSQLPIFHIRVWADEKRMAIYAPLKLGDLSLQPNRLTGSEIAAWLDWTPAKLTALLPDPEDEGTCHCCLEDLSTPSASMVSKEK